MYYDDDDLRNDPRASGFSRAIDGTRVPTYLDKMPCGGRPRFDSGSGYGYRCTTCNAVIGSVGQPRSCKEINSEVDL